MNEINKLVWPNPSGIGIMNTAAFNQTATIAKQFGVIAKARRAPTAPTWRRRPSPS